MSDVPPPPPPPPPDYRIPIPKPGVPRRPGTVTAGGVILIIVGALGIVVALALFSAADSGRFGDRFINPDTARTIGYIQLVVAALQIIGGILVFRLRPAGRIIGVIMGALGMLGAVIQISANGFALVSLGLNAFIFVALISNGYAFRPPLPR